MIIVNRSRAMLGMKVSKTTSAALVSRSSKDKLDEREAKFVVISLELITRGVYISQFRLVDNTGSLC